MNESVNNIKVSIKCLTYNHEKYIRKMIEGCLAQKTNFKFELIIHDDASTDGTQDIIKEYQKKYPDVIVSILQTENQYSKKNVSISQDYIFPIVKGNYIAFCEGDDYWTDENKLQMQVDYLDSHPECSFVFHDADIVWENGNYLRGFFQTPPKEIVSSPDIIDLTFIPTASIVGRTEYVIGYRTFCSGRAVCGDLPLMLSLSIDGYGYYINKKMSAYRVANPNSASGIIRNNRERLEQTHRGHVEILEGFNKQTNYKWDKQIRKNIDKRRLGDLMEVKDYQTIKSEGLLSMFKTLPVKTRIKFLAKVKLGPLYRSLRELRNIIKGFK